LKDIIDLEEDDEEDQNQPNQEGSPQG